MTNDTPQSEDVAVFAEKVAQNRATLAAQKKFEQDMVVFNRNNFLDTAQKFIEKNPYFYDKNEMWWMWDTKEGHWTESDDIEILNGIDAVLEIDPDKRITSAGLRNELVYAMKMRARQTAPQEPKATWVQFGDTIYDVLDENAAPQPASPKFFFFNRIPWALGESEDTPTIDRLFSEWVGPERVAALTEVIAYTTLPDYPIAAIVAFVGAGNNGKDQCLNFIHRFIGQENACASELDALSNSNNRFESARLYKKLLCVMGETNVGLLSKTSFIKRLTGRSLMPFEFKNKMPFSAYNYAKIFIATNALPPTTDKTHGFYRRWNIFEFRTNFDGRANPKILDTIPESEYRNFAKKALRILKETITRGDFKETNSVEEKAKIYERLSNPVAAFLSEFYEKCGQDSEIELFQLHNEYCDYAKLNGKLIISKEYLRKLLSADGYYTDKKVMTIDGIQRNRVHVYGIRKKGEDTTPGKECSGRPTLPESPQAQLVVDAPAAKQAFVRIDPPETALPCSYCKEWKPLIGKLNGMLICQDCCGEELTEAVAR